MLKLWSGDRVFGREARPPEWPYTNSSDLRGSRRKPRQWCRLLVYSISSPPVPPERSGVHWCVSAHADGYRGPLAQKKSERINA